MHDQPADIDACTARVRQQRLQELRHAAAGGRRVDVPDDAALQVLAQSLGGADQRLQVVASDDRPEPQKVLSAHADFSHENLLAARLVPFPDALEIESRIQLPIAPQPEQRLPAMCRSATEVGHDLSRLFFQHDRQHIASTLVDKLCE
jgi:hypothetical protein